MIPRWRDANNHLRLGQIDNAYQVSGLNQLTSPDRALTCALDGALGASCTSATVFSGGYADYTQANTLTQLIKTRAGTQPCMEFRSCPSLRGSSALRI